VEDNEILPKAIWSGSFFLGGVEMKCHVLDNGMRIIDAESIEAFFRSAEEGIFNPTEEESINLGKWIKGIKE